MSHLTHTKNKVKNGGFSLFCLKDVFASFLGQYAQKQVVFQAYWFIKSSKLLIRKIKPNFGVVDGIVPRCALKLFLTRKLRT